MKGFADFSIQTKLLIGLGLPVVLLLLVGATSYRSILTLQHSQTRLYEEDFADATDLLSFRAENNGLRAAILNLLISGREGSQAWQQDIRERAARISEITARLIERNRNEPEFLRRLQTLDEMRRTFDQTRDTEVLPLIAQGRNEEAQRLLIGVQEQRYRQIREIARILSAERTRRAEAAVRQSEQLATQETRIILFLSLAAVLLSLLLTWWLSRMIATPVQEMAALARQIATGDLSVSLPEQNRADEIGGLGRSLRGMVAGLRGITQEILEGINVLAASSNEILAATTQVAAGAVETATAVSQTTATVEEVKQTAQVTSQKAKQVSDSAGRVTQVSQRGRNAVDELIESMSGIHLQMETIAERIVNLSEHSQAIGEIISTVNDLAEQANLLAVNAAIEAARAGEQGKGFAIVAQEIRSLAEQSKQATRQVRTILTDIQKATAATALAAEQGSRTVETGFKRSTEAKEAIRTLTDSIAEASQSALQIATSSQQQTVGMDQVALAMGNIKQASQQNAASTRQAETAARNLYDLGQKLKHLIERYKV
ncbi:MAG TPA: methyl-accepting chemotaxis protein [Blastocatellia bacterium]|nr:methyl-accepting chemotaxis protein [Blastocatellia bacterium]